MFRCVPQKEVLFKLVNSGVQLENKPISFPKQDHLAVIRLVPTLFHRRAHNETSALDYVSS